jgi:hypothetical protein
MSPRTRRIVLIGLATWVVVAILAGAGFAFLHRHDTICSDGKPPLQQHDVALGQVEYRCHDGEIVKK